tara:strand:- start:6707 stop:7249 length:543 start_codon:yes stop_codon:yes gene_type:complete
VPARGVVPAFDELEAGNAGFGLCLELTPVEKLAFEGGEEALAHGVVVAVADRSHGWPDAHFLASEAEGHGRVLRSLVAMMDDAIGFARRDRHVHRIEHQLRSLPSAHGSADHTAAEGIQHDRQIEKACPGRHEGSLIDHLRSLILSRVSATCKVLFEVIPFGASSRHPRRRRPEGDIRDA